MTNQPEVSIAFPLLAAGSREPATTKLGHAHKLIAALDSVRATSELNALDAELGATT